MSVTGSRTQMALTQQAYTPAMRRARCGNCEYYRKGENPHLVDQCKKGGFMVTPWSVCKAHMPKTREAS